MRLHDQGKCTISQRATVIRARRRKKNTVVFTQVEQNVRRLAPKFRERIVVILFNSSLCPRAFGETVRLSDILTTTDAEWSCTCSIIVTTVAHNDILTKI